MYPYPNFLHRINTNLANQKKYYVHANKFNTKNEYKKMQYIKNPYQSSVIFNPFKKKNNNNVGYMFPCPYRMLQLNRATRKVDKM